MLTTKQAQEYGEKAEKAGGCNAPQFDDEFIAQIKDLEFNARIKLLKAWHRGWALSRVSD